MEEDNITEILDIFNLMQIRNDIIIRDYYNVVLVLGNTGSGKSSLVQFITENDESLTSIETAEETCEYIIQDDNERIGHSINSKTIFPEGIIDNKTHIVYYDCQGFGDTRNAAYDIASNVFRKRIIDYVKYIKIVLTVNYGSVSLGVDRTDFVKLLKRATEVIKNLQHFKDSISLVVTKVDNRSQKGQLVPDHNIINGIGNYMAKVKETLEERLLASADDDDRSCYEKEIELINILLTKANNAFVKIAIFRRPDEPGLLNQIQLLHSSKLNIRHVINDNMTFATSNTSFGYTISNNSKLAYQKLINKFTNPVQNNILVIFRHIPSMKENDEKEKKDFESESWKIMLRFLVRLTMMITANAFRVEFPFFSVVMAIFSAFMSGTLTKFFVELFDALTDPSKIPELFKKICPILFKDKSEEEQASIMDGFKYIIEYFKHEIDLLIEEFGLERLKKEIEKLKNNISSLEYISVESSRFMEIFKSFSNVLEDYETLLCPQSIKKLERILKNNQEIVDDIKNRATDLYLSRKYDKLTVAVDGLQKGVSDIKQKFSL